VLLESAKIEDARIVRSTSFYHKKTGELQLEVVLDTWHKTLTFTIPNNDGSRSCAQLSLDETSRLMGSIFL